MSNDTVFFIQTKGASIKEKNPENFHESKSGISDW